MTKLERTLLLSVVVLLIAGTYTWWNLVACIAR